MSLIILNVDEVRRTLSASGGAFVVHDKEVDIVRFAINSGFADIVLDGQVALRVMYQRPGETEVRAQTLTYHDTDGLHSYYDWQLLSADLAKKGTLTVALCILRTDSEVEEWHTTPCQIRVLDTIHTDDGDEADESITPTVAQRVAVLETMIQRVASGAPIVVANASAMTDTDQIYVLSTDGNWYYHNGTAWVAGGEYGAVATDTTLTQPGMAADAKAVGDAISPLQAELKSTLNQQLVYTNNEFNRIFEDGYVTKISVVNMTAGVGSLSSKKLIDVDIPANTKYAVLIQDQNNVLNGIFYLYEIDSNGQSGPSAKAIYANQKYELTATKTVKGLSLYIEAKNVVNSGSLGFVVYTDLHKNSNSIEEKANNAVPQTLFDDEIYGDMSVEYVPVVNGNFSASSLNTNIPNRLRTDAIPVRIGSVIVIENGSLKHVCGAWNGTIRMANNIRNDNAWYEERETIISEVDGYYVVVFAKQDATQNIVPSEFDGSVKVYSSNIYKNKQEIEELKANTITRDGIGQVETYNLADYRSNIMLYEDEHTVSGTGRYAYEVILNYFGPFAVGEDYIISADSVGGATSNDPFVIYHATESGTEIRQTGHSTKITAADIEAGLYRLAFGLRPATGTPMPTGSATYTGVCIKKGTEVEKTLAGDLREAVESIVGQKTASIPEYFTQNNYIQNKADRINTIAENADDVFIFISDIHWEMNARHSPGLIQYLASKCNIPKLFDGGDVANGIIQSAVDKYKNAFSRSIYRTVGNHDRFPPITGKNLYYAFDILNNEQVGNAFNHYYHVDNVQQKIRYVILNAFYHEGNETETGWSYYDEEQKNWFSQTALNLPSSDWDVIVFTHYLKTTSYLTGGMDIGNAIDNFNEQPGHTGKILAVFQGHTHWDGVYHTAGGVPVITITCDKWDLSNETSTIPAEGIAWREKNTIKEQAFDVVILNREARKFTCVRIGAPAQNNIDEYRTGSGFTWIGTLEEREITY